MTRLILLSSHAPPVEVRCDGCRHWDHEAGDGDFGVCALTRSEDSTPMHPETDAYATDFEGYMARLKTTARFGCIQFEERE